ncbi:MAG: hypothetical protein J0I09_14385 [Sphingobacteriia bacterium]|nr:hypothetical protein [Sphingobacteriia bacterium]
MKSFERNHDIKLSISDVGKRINKIGRSAIEEWLMRNNITIHKDTRKYVFAIDVETQLLLPLASNYKRKYTKDWKLRVQTVCGNNQQLYEMLMIELTNETTPPSTRVIPKTEFQKRLLDEMMK